MKEPNRLLTDIEAADRLGVCSRTVWTLAETGRLPRVRIGRSVRYDPDDLDAFIAACKPPSPPDCGPGRHARRGSEALAV
jgi:excisionase family DNA binding protein